MQSCHFFGQHHRSALQPQYFFHFSISDAVHALVQIDGGIAVLHPDLEGIANLERDGGIQNIDDAMLRIQLSQVQAADVF